jgi:hypothetical protein
LRGVKAAAFQRRKTFSFPTVGFEAIAAALGVREY